MFPFHIFSTHIYKLMGNVSKVTKWKKKEKKAKMLKHADDTELCWKNLLNLSHSIKTCHIELIQWNSEKVHYLERAIFFAWCVISSLLLLLNIYGDTENIEDVSAEKCRKEKFPSCNERIFLYFFFCVIVFSCCTCCKAL